MNENITIRDDNLSFIEIKSVMDKAHGEAKNDKLDFPTSSLSVEDLENSYKKNGKWFVACDNNKIVGTICAFKTTINTWYFSGEVLNLKYVAILPEYSGRHIVSKLYNAVFEYARKFNIQLCIMSMSEYNYHHRHVAEKNKFILTDFFAVKGLKNYSLTYTFWINDNCPHSKLKIKIMMGLRKIKAKIKRIILK